MLPQSTDIQVTFNVFRTQHLIDHCIDIRTLQCSLRRCQKAHENSVLQRTWEINETMRNVYFLLNTFRICNALFWRHCRWRKWKRPAITFLYLTLSEHQTAGSEEAGNDSPRCQPCPASCLQRRPCTINLWVARTSIFIYFSDSLPLFAGCSPVPLCPVLQCSVPLCPSYSAVFAF